METVTSLRTVLDVFRGEILAETPDAAGLVERLVSALSSIGDAPGSGSSFGEVRAFISRALPQVEDRLLTGEGGDGAKQVLARLKAELDDPTSTVFTTASSGAGSATTRTPIDGSPSAKRRRLAEGGSSADDSSAGEVAMTDASSSSSISSSDGSSAQTSSSTGAGAGAGASSSSSSAAAAPPAFESRDYLARKEEEAGMLQFRVIRNDGGRQHMIWLTQVKNIFATQLPKMPREYIARLVFDRKHRSLLAIKRDKVVGGICFRPFVPQRFGEIAFCAITSSEQVKGYGTRLMNHLKEAVKLDGLTHFLTYADNYAIGYFRKQGFTKTISMPHERWVGYIKDYDGGTLMECCVLANVDYLDVPGLVACQRARVLDAISARPQASAVYPPLDFSEAAVGAGPQAGEHYLRNLASVPGLTAAGWDPAAIVTKKKETNRATMAKALAAFTDQLFAHDDSWPFRDPVDINVVPDYLTVVQKPIDLSLLRTQVAQIHYRSLEHFLEDVSTIFDNCRKYNRPDTEYVACANKLDLFVKSRIPSLQAAVAATQQ